MYTACARCGKIGPANCRGPVFTDMTMPEIVEWIRLRLTFLGWSRAKLAEESRTPIGTVNRVLSAQDGGGFKWETIAPMLATLTFRVAGELPCPDPSDPMSDQLRERCRHLEQELFDTKSFAQQAREDHKAAEVTLTQQSRNLRKALSFVSAALFVVLLAIIAALICDVANPNIGYFRG